MKRHLTQFIGIISIATGLCLCAAAFFSLADTTAAQEDPEFVGEGECNDCHGDHARAFSTTRHALTLLETEDEDTVILADFDQGEELRMVQFPGEENPRAFTLDDVAFVMGAGRYAQSFVYEEDENVYRVFPAQWNVIEGSWQALTLADEWSDPAYDWGQNCAGCHTTGYDLESTDWVDAGVQCEACHGAGSTHVDAADELPRNAEPEEVDVVRAAILINPGAEVCGQCHSGGTSGENPFPAGYVAGDDLLAQYTLAPMDDEVHWWSGGHAKQPNMQFNEWLNTGHASALDDLLNSDYAEDACLECHSADYRLRQRQIELFEAGESEGSSPQPLTLAEAQNGVSCSACHQTHGDTGYEFGLVDENYPLCTSCHQDTDLTPEVHHPAQEMYEGHFVFDGVNGSPSTHFTAENSPDCVTCHMPQAPVGDGTRSSHALHPVMPDGENSPPQDTCTVCHTDLSPQYMQKFIEGTQEKVSVRLEGLNEALANNPGAPQWVFDVLKFVETDGSLGVHNYAYTDALLDAAAIELGVVEAPGRSLPPDMIQVVDPAACEECHRDEVRNWQDSPHANASLNNNFLSEFADRGRPTYCMSCHGSGYDPTTGIHQFEGVICTSCHILPNNTEHPPAPVEIATDSAVCGTCHSGAHAPTYDEWLVSEHQLAGVDCVDCHTPHDNGLILGDVNTTCGDCHVEATTDDIHMGEDMDCTDCHLTRRTTENDVHVLSTGHTMAIDPSVCAECHGNTHLLSVRQTNQDEQDVDLVADLQGEVTRLQDQADEDRNTGIIGGALGALLVMILLFILYRFRSLF